MGMRNRRVVSKSAFLLCSLAASVALVLLTHRSGPEGNQKQEGVVYVYFPSLCDAPGAFEECHEVLGASRPAFESMGACATYANGELRRQNNPKLIANCVWRREG
jgi:hypothetical protein